MVEKSRKTKSTKQIQAKRKIRVVKDKKDETKEKQSEYFCHFCDEAYTDLPHEDWRMCSKSHRWLHESCIDYDKKNIDDYCCDHCRSNN